MNASESSRSNFSLPFSTKEIVFPSVLLLLFFIFSLLLNALIICVILLKIDLKRNVIYVVILSLCLSDTLSTLVSPLFWYRRTIGFETWKLPKFFCKLYWFFDFTTSCATSLHIILFALLRYIVVKNEKMDNIKMIYMKITVGMIWLISAVCAGIPFAIFYDAKSRNERPPKWKKWPACTLSDEWVKENLYYERVALPLFFAIPTVLIATFSVMIWKIVRSNANVARERFPNHSVRSLNVRKRREKRIVLQLTLIVSSFFIGYLPIMSYEILATTPGALKTSEIDYWFGFAAYIFLRFSECLNPVFYIFGSANIRQKTKMYLKSLIGKEDKQITHFSARK